MDWEWLNVQFLLFDTSRKAKNKHVKKEQGTKTKERKKPESKQTTGASEEKPLTTLRKEGKLKNNNNKQTNRGKHKFHLISLQTKT